MAIDSVSDCLLGVSINVEAKNQDENKTLEESIEEYNHPKFKHILTVLHRYVLLFIRKFKIQFVYVSMLNERTHIRRNSFLTF